MTRLQELLRDALANEPELDGIQWALHRWQLETFGASRRSDEYIRRASRCKGAIKKKRPKRKR